MIHPPFYDPERSYEENLAEGPFAGFADDVSYSFPDQPSYQFCGHPVAIPFGIPAGPLINGAFVQAALQKGFALPMYKTVRTSAKTSHPAPNVLPVKVEGPDLTIEQGSAGLTSMDEYQEPLAITNSFGVPSFDPDVWQPDLAKVVASAGDGQLVIGSFQGTNAGKGVEAFIEDHVLAARLVKETKAPVLELNLSCPNEGTTDLLCFDRERVRQICQRVKDEIGDTPLLIKLAYFADDDALRQYVTEIGPIVDGFSAINTIQAAVRTPDGQQALPGEGRLLSGVCGSPIRWAGRAMVKKLAKLRQERDLDYTIVGVGGVTTAADVTQYLDDGADAVMSATGAMWNPWLAIEVAEECGVTVEKEDA